MLLYFFLFFFLYSVPFHGFCNTQTIGFVRRTHTENEVTDIQIESEWEDWEHTITHTLHIRRLFKRHSLFFTTFYYYYYILCITVFRRLFQGIISLLGRSSAQHLSLSPFPSFGIHSHGISLSFPLLYNRFHSYINLFFAFGFTHRFIWEKIYSSVNFLLIPLPFHRFRALVVRAQGS